MDVFLGHSVVSGEVKFIPIRSLAIEVKIKCSLPVKILATSIIFDVYMYIFS